MNSKVKFILIGGIAIVLLLAAFAWQKSGLLGNIGTSYNATTTSQTVSINLIKLLPEKNGAQRRTISNRGDTAIHLLFASASSTFSSSTLGGYILFASTTLDMTEELGNLWNGNIWATTQVGTSSVSTMEQ